MHSILHSLFPRRLRSHSMPKPVHSVLLRSISPAAAPARAPTVVLSISSAVALKLSAPAPPGAAAINDSAEGEEETIVSFFG